MRTIGLLILISILPAPTANAETSIYTTLSKRRSDISLPAYTPEEKQLVAEQAQTILRDIYVNREVKIASYGSLVDPVPKIASIVADARVMSMGE